MREKSVNLLLLQFLCKRCYLEKAASVAKSVEDYSHGKRLFLR